jgi:hypothetical protein
MQSTFGHAFRYHKDSVYLRRTESSFFDFKGYKIIKKGITKFNVWKLNENKNKNKNQSLMRVSRKVFFNKNIVPKKNSKAKGTPNSANS